MSLRYAILGLLHYSDMSGYDLYQHFDRSIRHYWSTEHTQIYRALSALAKDESITYTLIEQSGRPDKKVYRLTPRGRSSFTTWLRSRPPLPEIRHTHLLQFSLMSPLPTKAITDFLESYAALIEEKLILYRDADYMETTWRYARNTKERAIWQLVLDNGIRYYEAELAWCRHAIDVLGGIENEGD